MSKTEFIWPQEKTGIPCPACSKAMKCKEGIANRIECYECGYKPLDECHECHFIQDYETQRQKLVPCSQHK